MEAKNKHFQGCFLEKMTEMTGITEKFSRVYISTHRKKAVISVISVILVFLADKIAPSHYLMDGGWRMVIKTVKSS